MSISKRTVLMPFSACRLAVCPLKGVSSLMAPLAQLQQLASCQISNYPQAAAPDNADARRCGIERLPVADQVCHEMFACPPTY